MIVNITLDTNDPLDHECLLSFLSVTRPETEGAPEAPEKKEKKPSKTPAEKAKSKEPAKPEPTPEPGPPAIDMKDVLSKAVELLSSHGEDALASILKKLEISRVKDCPPEKLADLLTEISTYE